MFFFLLTNIITNDRQLERMKISPPVGSLSNPISGSAAAAAAALSISSD